MADEPIDVGAEELDGALDDVVITAELAHRPARAPDHEAEARALRALARELATDPGGLLQKVADAAMTLCRADSAAVCLRESADERDVYRWRVVAGALAPSAPIALPNDVGPCSDVMRSGEVQLLDRPARCVPALRGLTPAVQESLLAPWRIDGAPAGTLWVLSQRADRHFDAEDARLLASLADFAAAAWQIVRAGQSASAERAREQGHAQARAGELRESDARFRAVANLVPGLLWQNDPDGTVTWHSDRWYAYTGWNAAPHAERDWSDIVHPDDRDTTRRQWSEALREERPFAREHRLRGADGAYRWFLVRAEPSRDETGRVVHWFGAATDVHEQRLAMDDVERRVAERTAELASAHHALAESSSARSVLLRQLSLAEEEERRRLARELHDEAGQHLTALGLGLQALSDVAPPGSDVDRRAAQLRGLADTLGRELHAIAVRLRPRALDDFGLEAALQSYAEEWARQSGIAVDVHAHGHGPRLSPAAESVVYRIVQEALTNVARHSGATRAGVVLERRDGYIHLAVEDDGRGFVPDRVERTPPDGVSGLGLLGIRERTALIGGSMVIESAPGKGTTLFVRFPIDVESGRMAGAVAAPQPGRRPDA